MSALVKHFAIAELLMCVCVLQFIWTEFIVLATKLCWSTVLNYPSLRKLVCTFLVELILLANIHKGAAMAEV